MPLVYISEQHHVMEVHITHVIHVTSHMQPNALEPGFKERLYNELVEVHRREREMYLSREGSTFETQQGSTAEDGVPGTTGQGVRLAYGLEAGPLTMMVAPGQRSVIRSHPHAGVGLPCKQEQPGTQVAGCSIVSMATLCALSCSSNQPPVSTRRQRHWDGRLKPMHWPSLLVSSTATIPASPSCCA
jgi:hypothetical protein